MGLFDIFRIKSFKDQINRLSLKINELETRQKELGFTTYEQTKKANDELTHVIEKKNNAVKVLTSEYETLSIQKEKTEKAEKAAQRKLAKSKELFKAIDYSINSFHNGEDVLISQSIKADLDELSPSVILKLHCLDVKDLRKAYRENDKAIESVMQTYASRYTTKANQAIYKLMVIALRAELQNILINLKYEKLDEAVNQVKKVTEKYLAIATEGNQNIAGTMRKFIGEIEYLFTNAVKIEYNYYVKKEQARQEQLAIREQMRQEAEERKALEAEKKKIEAEEKKYQQEIEKAKSALETANAEEAETLRQKIVSLESMLSDVIVKKDEIVTLQNGKAGNIYVISNLGSFGENVFKIGMTRRINPQDRVDELGSASVPFKFDVHSFIFSEDAVALETKLHKELNNKRVNKVNLRKEFFYATVDELETLVQSIDPTAEFNKTMIADEFRQSLSSTDNYTSDFSLDDFDDEE